MKYTNKHNLPESVYNLLAKERYQGGDSTDYSVTTLLQPPRITQLKRRYNDQLEEDVMDSVWSLFGQVAHSLLEEHGAENALSEERIYREILGRTISGQVDSYHDGIITDYKVTSAWTLVYGSRLHEWTEQLNLYAYLFRSSGYVVSELRICTILRDWDRNKAKYDSSYPQTPIIIIPIKLWSIDEAESFAYERVIEHKEAEDKIDRELPLCSDEDRWCQPTKYAIKKVGAVRATRVFDTEKEAVDYGRDTMKMEYQLETRRGKCTRCEDYCSVNLFCSQYQEYLRSME